MIKIDIDTDKINKGIKAAELAFNAIENVLGKEGFEKFYWPKLRERIKEYLIRNLGDLGDVPTSRRWRGIKRELMGRPASEYRKLFARLGYEGYTTQRYIGGEDLQIITDESWHATGTMEDVIKERLGADQGTIRGTADVFSAELNVSVSDLVDQYPLIVDEQIMERSGGEKGIMRLFAKQQDEIVEMLIHEGGNLSEELFRGNK